MMKPVARVNGKNANPYDGYVAIDYAKAFWNLGIAITAIIFAPVTYTVDALILFVTLTYFSLLIGHSVGMHRFMIHRTFSMPKWLEYCLVYIGVLVGMAGPLGIIKIHDLRDWTQRQAKCHDFFSHQRHYFIDLWWQLTSRFVFDKPPIIEIEPEFSNDKFYQFLERTWRWHQLLLAFILYMFGGWPFVIWGVFVRVSVSVIGHWTITYICHNPGPGKWIVKNASVQASNIPGLGILTYGECWHNNHHAFPESARIGIEKNQTDPGWWLIKSMENIGLAYNIGLPRSEQERTDLYQKNINEKKETNSGKVEKLCQ
ncbi:MAG: acyl-CoA desaturase [Cellvibrionaceae bacterium]